MNRLHAIRSRKQARSHLKVGTALRATLLFMIGAFSANVFAHCVFENPTTSSTPWEQIGSDFTVKFYRIPSPTPGESGTDTAKLPNFDTDDCPTGATIEYRLYKGSTRLIDGDSDGDLTLGTGVTLTLNSGNIDNEATFIFAHRTTSGWGPTTFTVKAFNTAVNPDKELDRFSFTIAVLPPQLAVTSVSAQAAQAVTTDNIQVIWTGDGASGDAKQYEVMWCAQASSTATDCAGSSSVQTKTVNEVAGSTAQRYAIKGLLSRTNYVVGVRAKGPDRSPSAYQFASLVTTFPTLEGSDTMRAGDRSNNPIRVADDGTTTIPIGKWFEPIHAVTDNTYHSGITYTTATRSGDTTALDVDYISDADNDHTDDVIRLRGKKVKNLTTAVVELRGSDGTVFTSTIHVTIGTKARAIFTVTSATTRWDVEAADASAFTFDVKDFVKSAILSDTSETLTYSMKSVKVPGGVQYLVLNSSTGIISVDADYQDAGDLDVLQSGDEFEYVVTVVDKDLGSDSFTLNIDVQEGDDPPIRIKEATIWMDPITESNGGGTRRTNVASYFTDPDGGALCYKITRNTATKTINSKSAKVADFSLSGTTQCPGPNLNVTMNLPSTNPASDEFALLGYSGLETVEFDIVSFQDGDAQGAESDPVTVKVDLVYGTTNVAPIIRKVAKVTGTNTYVTTGAHTVNENHPIQLTFTADDSHPKGDYVCWSAAGQCKPCKGTSDPRASDRKSGDISHEFDLVVKASKTDYEKYPNGYTINLCATDLAGATENISFLVMLKDQQEPPRFKTIPDLYFLVGDYSETVDLREYVSDGDGITDITSFEANKIGSSTAVKVAEVAGIVTVTPTTNSISSKASVDIEVMATDSKGNTATAIFTAYVKNRNSSPAFSGGFTAVTYSVAEDTKGGTEVGSAIVAQDSDVGDVVSYAISPNDYFEIATTNQQAKLKVKAKAKLDFEKGPKLHDLTVTASDGYGGSASLRVYIKVTDVNEPPVASKVVIPDQRVLLGMTSCDISAMKHFTDPDEADINGGLLISVSSTRPGDARATIKNNDEVCIEARAIGTGPARITITARDRGNLSAYKRFRVYVEQNNPPMTASTGGLQDMDVQLDGRSEDMDLYQYFDDGDVGYEEKMNFTIKVADADIASGVIVREQYLRIYGSKDGTTNITVTATDQNKQSHSQTFAVTVIRNDPPVANQNAIADVDTRIGQSIDYIDAGDAFEDEGDSFTLSLGTDDANVATASLSYDDDGNPWIRIYLHSVGATTATLTAIDTANNVSTVTFEINVGERNDPPTLVKEIADITVELDGREDISLEGVFEDEDELDITLEVEDDNVADVVYRSRMNLLRVYGYQTGDTDVTVTATDELGQSASDTFNVIVARGVAPVVAMRPDPLALGKGSTRDVDLDDVFNDADGDVLTYSATSSDSSVATVRVSGSMLYVTAVEIGDATVSVTATDPYGLSATTNIKVAVGPADSPPVVVRQMDPITIEADSYVDISVVGVFKDDGELTYSSSSSDDNIAEAVYRAASETLRVYGWRVGVATITVTATDEIGQQAETSFELTVEPANDPPFLSGTLDDQTVTVGEPMTVMLTDAFTDPDGDALTFTASSGNTGLATVNVSGATLTITGVSHGSTTISITASDPRGLSVTGTFQVMVETAPMLVGEFEDQTVTAGVAHTVSVGDNFEDKDGDALTYTAASSDTKIATTSVDGDEVTIDGLDAGEVTITVTASDPKGRMASGSFEVVVETAPMLVEEFDDQVVTAGDEVLTISITGKFVDRDGDVLTYSASSSDESIAMVSMWRDQIDIDGVDAGTVTVTVTATDPKGRSASGTFIVVVETAPMLVEEFDDQVMTAGEPLMVSIEGKFEDRDGDEMTYSAMSSDTDIATVSVDGEMLTIDGMDAGTVTITVTAMDPKGRSASGDFEVVVETAPMLVGTLDDQVMTAGEPLMVSIAGKFEDRDGDPLTYTATSSDTDIATVSVDGEELQIDGTDAGTVTITVTAMDPKGRSASGAFDVVVETVPEAVGQMADVNMQIGSEAMVMDVAPYFTDRDGDALEYSVAVEGTAVQAGVEGAAMTLTPFTRGTATVTVSAADPKQRMAQQTFMATVGDSELKAVANEALGGFGRAVIGSVSNAIGSRLEGNRSNSSASNLMPVTEPRRRQAPRDERQQDQQPTTVYATTGQVGPQRSSPPADPAPAPAPRSGGISWGVIPGESSTENRSGSNFRGLVGNGFSQYLNGDGGMGSVSVWGALDARNLEGTGYDGNASAFFLGADVKLNPNFMIGAAVAHNRGESDYSWGSAKQTLETTVSSVMPYVSYQPSEGTIVWGIVGRGSGEATTTVVNAASESSDLTMNLGMFGGSARFADLGVVEMSAKGDVAFVNLSTEDGNGAAEGLEASVNRMRLGIEAAMDYSVPGAMFAVMPYGEMNLRYDGGDGEAGSGLELAGGLRVKSNGFALELRGFGTVAHSIEDFSESGISVMAMLNPSGTARGLSLSLTPSWGETNRPQSLVWSDVASVGSLAPRSAFDMKDGFSVNANVGYGFVVDQDRYLLKPYLEYGEDASDNTSMLLGAELQQLIVSSQVVDMNLMFGRMNTRENINEDQFEFNATLRF